MTSQKLTERSELTATAIGDLVHVVDVSDLTDSPAGSSRKVKLEHLLPDTGAEAGTYGSSSQALVIEINAKGQIVAIGTTPAISAGHTHTQSGNYQMLATDGKIDVCKDTPEATNIILPVTPVAWKTYTVTDAALNCSSYPITLVGTINDITNYQFDQDGRSRSFHWNPDIDAWRFE